MGRGEWGTVSLYTGIRDPFPEIPPLAVSSRSSSEDSGEGTWGRGHLSSPGHCRSLFSLLLGIRSGSGPGGFATHGSLPFSPLSGV